MYICVVIVGEFVSLARRDIVYMVHMSMLSTYIYINVPLVVKYSIHKNNDMTQDVV